MFIQVIVIVSSLMCVNLQKSHLEVILKSENNDFRERNGNMHTLLNNMFTMLKLKSNFTQLSKINLLLIMHNDLNNIAENVFMTYEDLRNLTKVEYNNKIITFDMTKILDEVLKESDYNNSDINSGNNTMKIEINNNATTEHKNIMQIKVMENVTNDSNFLESLEIVQGFLQKINNLTVNGILTESFNETNESDVIFPLKENLYHRELKLWDPPTSAEKLQLFNETTLNRRIYKGKNTKIKKFPFMASIHVMNQFTCAGSIVSKDLVITAASCLHLAYNNRLFRENPSLVFIRVGSDYTKRFGETIPVIDIHFHPLYDPTTLRNNLVLLRMTRQLRFSKKKIRIRRIEYDKTAEKIPDNVDRITILGWGATDEIFGVKDYQQLSIADIDVYNTEDCQEIYSKHYVSEKNFCAGFVSKGGGACNRDVGGPGLVDGILMGVISFGSPVCGAPDAPTVFTKLGYYAQWIDGIIKTEPTIKSVKTTTTSKKPLEIGENIKQAKFTIKPMRYRQDLSESRSKNLIDEYPEEIEILLQLLNDIVLRNSSVVDELLYADLNNDFNEMFKTTQREHFHQHPLVNKSIYMFPILHTFGNEDTETEAYVFGITTPHPRPIFATTRPDRDSVYRLPSKATRALVTSNKDTKYFNDKMARYKKVTSRIDIENEFPKSTSEEKISESADDDVSNNYEQTDNHSDYEGLSIDIGETKNLNTDTKLKKSTTMRREYIARGAKHKTAGNKNIDSSEDKWIVLNSEQHLLKKLQTTSKRVIKPSNKPEFKEHRPIRGTRTTHEFISHRELIRPNFIANITTDSDLGVILGRTKMISDEEYDNHEREYKRTIESDRMFPKFFKYY